MMSSRSSGEVHLPAPSLWPIAVAASILLMAVGVLSGAILIPLGLAGLVASIVGWVVENRHGEGSHHD